MSNIETCICKSSKYFQLHFVLQISSRVWAELCSPLQVRSSPSTPSSWGTRWARRRAAPTTTTPTSATPSPQGSSLGTITWTSLWGCREEPTWAARWVELSSWLLDFFLQTCLQVVLYNTNLTNLHNLTGDQIGAYFGYTIATCDINGDGLDDILIGAPMWTDFTVMGKFETGRVYVVYQDKNVSLTDWPP